ncbi:MAG: hypothetical protein M0R77_07505 [Gammaproteobacteria bacterium]|nr:hypothetical protein [Gammaproteobacteria bacterium]
MIDFNKPVQTIKGKPVIVITTNGPDQNFPIVGHIKNSEVIRSWNLYGKLRKGSESFNIQNAPPLDDFVVDIVDGNGRLMANVKVMPEENRISVETKEGISLYKNGKSVNEVAIKRESAPAPVPEGDLASAFFKQFSSNGRILDDGLEETDGQD